MILSHFKELLVFDVNVCTTWFDGPMPICFYLLLFFKLSALMKAAQVEHELVVGISLS